MSELHIIFTREEVLVSRKRYASWREIQDEYNDYMASLGPWEGASVASWLDEEYDDLVPSAQVQVESLLSSEQIVRRLSFAQNK